MNGPIVVRVPPAAKANVRLRTQNGKILTDFDDKELATKIERAPSGPRAGGSGPDEDSSATVLSEQTRAAIRAAARVTAAQAIREAAQAAREGANGGAAPFPAPLPPLPPMTGGKIVTGTLNGGGPEIQVATLNGDVTLRKIGIGKPTDAK